MELNQTTIANSEVEKKKMGLPHITTFCWCMGLEVGSRVIGYIHLMVSTTMVTLCSLSAASAGAHMGLEEDGEERIYSRWFTVALVVAVASLVHILLAATLIYAVHKRNTCALVVWVRVMCVLFAAALIYVLVSMIAYKAHGSGSEIFLAFLEGVLFFDGQSNHLNLFNSRPQPKKKRKSRTAFTNHQIFELEKRFLYQKYLSPADRDEIASSLGLSNAQVITWFQNRRAKLKRDMEELKKDVESAKVLSAHKTFLENVTDLGILKKKAMSIGASEEAATNLVVSASK